MKLLVIFFLAFTPNRTLDEIKLNFNHSVVFLDVLGMKRAILETELI